MRLHITSISVKFLLRNSKIEVDDVECDIEVSTFDELQLELAKWRVAYEKAKPTFYAITIEGFTTSVINEEETTK